MEHVDLLDQVNFRRRVTKSNKEEAVEAIKAHFLMYRCLPGLLQYMEGNKVCSIVGRNFFLKAMGFFVNFRSNFEEKKTRYCGHLAHFQHLFCV